MPTDADYDAAITEYEQSDRTTETVAQIAAKYGISRPAFYLRLRRDGIAPRRQAGAVPPNVDARVVLNQLAMAQREIGRLEARIAELEKEHNPA